MKNKHIGSNFNEFLKEDSIYKETNDISIKRIIAYQLRQEMKAQKTSEIKMAQMMNTSQDVVNRLLNPDNSSLTLNTLINATRVLGKKLNISIL